MTARIAIPFLAAIALGSAAPPVITWPSGDPDYPRRIPLFRPYELQVQADGVVDRFRASGLPPGLVINPLTGVISGSLAIKEYPCDEQSPGEWISRVWAENADGRSAPVRIKFNEGALHWALTTDALLIPFGPAEPFTFSFTGFLPISSADEISFSSLPPGITFDSTRTMLSGSVATPAAWPATMSISSQGAKTDIELLFWVQAGGTAPTTSYPPAHIESVAPLGTPTDLTPEFSPGLSFDHVGVLALPPGLSCDPSTGRITGELRQQGGFESYIWTSENGQPRHLIRQVIGGLPLPSSSDSIPASEHLGDDQAPADNDAFGLLYANSNYAGTYLPSHWSLNVDRLSIAGNLPPGISVDLPTGQLSGAPTTVGLYESTFTGRNAAGVGTKRQFCLVVDSAIAAPVPPLPSSFHGRVGQPFEHQISVADADSFHAALLPDGISIDPHSGLVSGTPVRAGKWSTWFWTAADGVPSFPHNKYFTIYPVGEGLPKFLSGDLIAPSSGSLPIAVEFEGDYLGMTVTGAPGDYSVGAESPSLETTDWPVGIHPLTIEVATTAGSAPHSFTARIIPQYTPSSWPVAPDESAYYLCPREEPYEWPYVAAGVSGRQFFASYSTDSLPAPIYSALNLPPGLSIDPATGDVSGTPTADGRFRSQIIAEEGETTVYWPTLFRIYPSQQNVEIYVGHEFIPKTTPVRVAPGEPLTLTALAWGMNPSYRWSRDGVPLEDGGGIEGAFSPQLRIGLDVPDLAGSYKVEVISDDGAATADPLEVIVGQSYAGWASETGAGDPDQAAATSPGSGFTNLEAFAYGLGAGDPHRVPLEFSWTNGQNFLTFQPPRGLYGITYTLESTTALDLPWQEIATEANTLSSPGAAELVLGWPLPAEEQRFYRVSVSMP